MNYRLSIANPNNISRLKVCTNENLGFISVYLNCKKIQFMHDTFS